MRDATRIRVHAPAIFQISIHAPHAGRDEAGLVVLVDRVQFQSTRPMRDATSSLKMAILERIFQSTRPMRDATVDCIVLYNYYVGISIHAPHAGRDAMIRNSSW